MQKLRSISFSFPTVYTILFVLTGPVALGTWIVPAGQYQRAFNEELGRETAAPGTCARVEVVFALPFVVMVWGVSSRSW